MSALRRQCRDAPLLSRLGILLLLAYCARVIAFLRCVGLFNAAVWFGAAMFFTFGVQPAAFSQEMKGLLEAKNYPYFSGAIAQLLTARYFHLQIVCGVVALLHLLVEWVYLGKSGQKLWLGLLIALFAAALLGGGWLQPKLERLHTTIYAVNTPPRNRIAASQSFGVWHRVFTAVNLAMLAGLAVYLWRVAHPSDPTRFVSTAKFRT